ncbi:MAG: sigma-70 family RNA polymerase sigma factor [Gammaproteobacteria bacterium]|nr:sigma-70 family RNA polymerase sigma factor [Gammaproteobacteria bacterium]
MKKDRDNRILGQEQSRDDEAKELDPRELARYFGSTRRLASVLLGAESLGEDAAQDVILAALERKRQIHKNPAAWFLGAVRRRLLHIRRSQINRQDRELRVVQEDRGETLFEPHAAVVRAEMQERLVSIVMDLPDPYRTVCVLHYLEENDTREVAEELGRPISTVHTQLHRGLAMLRDRLSADDERTGDDWSQALGVLLIPHLGSIRNQVERVHASSGPPVTSSLRTAAAALAIVCVGAVAFVLSDGKAGLEPSKESAQNPDHPVKHSGSSGEQARESHFEQRETLSTAETTELEAAPSVADSTPDQLHIEVRSSKGGQPLPAAHAFQDFAPSPTITSTVRAEDRATASVADEFAIVELDISYPAWVRVEAEGYVGSLLYLSLIHI